MAEFEGSKPVQTIRDDEFKIQIVDGASGTAATRKVSVVQEGDAFAAATNDSGIPTIIKDSAGNALIPSAGAGGGLSVELFDADGDELAISTAGEAHVRIHNAQGVDGAVAPAEAVAVAGVDAAGNLQTLLTDSTGKVIVIPSEEGTNIIDYAETASAPVGTPQNIDYVVTNATTFKGEKVLVGCRGRVKVRVGTYNGTTFTPFFCYYQDPKENFDHDIQNLSLAGDGTNAIRIEVTNQDGSANDIHTTLQGREV